MVDRAKHPEQPADKRKAAGGAPAPAAPAAAAVPATPAMPVASATPAAATPAATSPVDSATVSPPAARDPEGDTERPSVLPSSPVELYRQERARRGLERSEQTLMSEARAAYQALLKQEAAQGKGGRPRGKTNAAAAVVKPEEAAVDEVEIDVVEMTGEHEVIGMDTSEHAIPEPEEEHEEEAPAPPPPPRAAKPAKAAAPARKGAPAPRAAPSAKPAARKAAPASKRAPAPAAKGGRGAPPKKKAR